jgi:hypothetical protein
MHMAGGGERIAGERHGSPVQALEQRHLDQPIDVAGAARIAAIGDENGLAEAGMDRGGGLQDIGLEGGAADHVGIGPARANAEILRRAERREEVIEGAAAQPIDVGEKQPGIVQRGMRRARHQLERRPARGGAETGISDAGYRHLAAQLMRHEEPPSGRTADERRRLDRRCRSSRVSRYWPGPSCRSQSHPAGSRGRASSYGDPRQG